MMIRMLALVVPATFATLPGRLESQSQFGAQPAKEATFVRQAVPGEDWVPKVEYQAGHAGMEEEVEGSLVISDTSLTFLGKTGNPLIAIPLSRITNVSSSIDRKEASVGSKLAFGFLAKSRKEELITVQYESEQTAEGIIFKTEKNMSAGTVAKINFHMKRAGVALAADSSGAKVIPHPAGPPSPGAPTQP
jgi:hypothetical protein